MDADGEECPYLYASDSVSVGFIWIVCMRDDSKEPFTRTGECP